MASGPSSSPAVTAPPVPFFRARYLYLLTGLGTVYLLTTALAPSPWVEVPFGLVAYFLTPGYALGALALGARPRWPWTLSLALVVGWSVAFDVAEGLLLLVLGVGLPPVLLAGTSFAVAGLSSVVWSFTAPNEPVERATTGLVDGFRMKGYGTAHRRTAVGLLAAIVAVLGVIVYLASVFPGNAPSVSIGITGAGGTTTNLPPGGPTNSTLVIWVVIGNGATAQTFTLEVRTATQGSSPVSYTQVPWANPIVFSNDTDAQESVALAASGSTTVHVQFQYTTAGKYTLGFLLEDQGGAVVRSTAWPLTIT